MAMNPISEPTIGRKLAHLLSHLYLENKEELKGLVERLIDNPEIPVRHEFPGEKTSTAEFSVAAIEILRKHEFSNLHDLQLQLLEPQDEEDRRGMIEDVLGRATLWAACQKDGRAIKASDLYAVSDAHQLFRTALDLTSEEPHAAILQWCRERQHHTTPETRSFPTAVTAIVAFKLLRLEDGGYDVAIPELRRLGCRPVSLSGVFPRVDPAQPSAGGIDRVRVGTVVELAELATNLCDEAARIVSGNIEDIVLIIEAEPEVIPMIAINTEEVPRSERRMAEYLRGIAWWPWINGNAAVGCAHDGPIPAPSSTTNCRIWDPMPPTREERNEAKLGVWVAHGICHPSRDCPTTGKHGARYFAVLADRGHKIRHVVGAAHPGSTHSRIESIFDAVRGQAQLIWTDIRFSRTTGSHQQ